MNVLRNDETDEHHDREGHNEQDDEPVAGFNAHADRLEPALNLAATKSQFTTFHHAAI